MHIVTITTTTPTGELLHQDTLTTTGSHAEALDLAAHHAAATTIDIHADDPYKHHAHLIALGDELDRSRSGGHAEMSGEFPRDRGSRLWDRLVGASLPSTRPTR